MYIIFDQLLLETVKELPRVSSASILAINDRYWASEAAIAFDEKWTYRQVVLSDVPKFSFLQVFLARICYNPSVPIRIEWKKQGEYQRSDVISALKLALKGDDDCIQQWFDGKHVIKLIEDARSFDEMLLGARAIQGDHDTDPDVMAYVKRILGDEW